MTYDRVKKPSWTPPGKTTSSFFPQTHIQTKKETKPSWEVTGVHTTKEAMERIRRRMFGSVEPIVEAPKETAPQESQQVQNPTPVSEEAGTSPPTIPQSNPLKGGEGVREGSQVEAGGEEKGLAMCSPIL